MKALDMASDELNVLFNEVSALLDREYHGVYAETSVSVGLSLGFACVDNVWGLIAILEPNHRAIPLTSAPREIRVQCAGALISLRKTLSRAAEHLDVRLVMAKREVRKFIEWCEEDAKEDA